MSIQTLQSVFLALAGCVIFFWLVYALTGQPKIDRPGTLHVLRYGSFLRTLALILALSPPVLMACVIWLLPWRNVNILTIAGLSFLATSIIAGLLLYEVEGSQTLITEDAIARCPRWRKPVELKWSEVEYVGYSAVNRWFVIKGVGRTIHISRHLVGIGGFVEVVRRKIAAERLASAAAALNQCQ